MSLLQAAKVAPKDPDLRKKLAECEKAIKRIKFEEALSTPVCDKKYFHDGSMWYADVRGCFGVNDGGSGWQPVRRPSSASSLRRHCQHR
jgi:hypothetical protein